MCKVQSLNILLIKETITSFPDCTTDSGTDEYNLRSDISFDGIIYAYKTNPRPPKWLDFLAEGSASSLTRLSNVSSSALLLVRVNERIFAISFGYGRNLLKQDVIERNFGLRVVLNRVDPNELKSLDARSFEELAVHTRRQTSQGTQIERFELDTYRDLLRAVTGKPLDKDLARRLSGSDSLKFSQKLSFDNLDKKLIELLEAYNDNSYKENYAFIDYLQPVKDPLIEESLNNKLIEDILKDGESLILAPPEPINWEECESIVYSEFKKKSVNRYEEQFKLSDCLQEINKGSELTVQDLKKMKVGIITSGSDWPNMKWSSFDCIVYEVTLSESLYSLVNGDWYKADINFVNVINDKIKDIDTEIPILIPAGQNDSEEVYNNNAATISGSLCMDRKLITVNKSEVEVCDILTSDGNFIHVKPWKTSSTLSHLFSQGLISCELFLHDPKYRRDIKEKIRSKFSPDQYTQFEPLIPDHTPTPGNYKVTYAIIRKQSDNWPVCLPFFSKLNLYNFCNRVERMGFKVQLARIDRL